MPILKNFGVDPIHFGVVMTMALSIGFVTPPYGANLFVASAITGLRVETIAKAAAPFLLALTVCLLLVAFVPNIAMGLVHLMRT
jgi:C4-dicarboxylate transporter DctM subunit